MLYSYLNFNLIACQRGNLSIVDFLLKQGANKELMTNKGSTPLNIGDYKLH